VLGGAEPTWVAAFGPAPAARRGSFTVSEPSHRVSARFRTGAVHRVTAWPLTPINVAVLEAFVLRARRVMQHSLIRDQRSLMNDLCKGQFTVSMMKSTETGEVTRQSMREPLPPEELFESLAARMRPLILAAEPTIYYERVFDAVEALVPAESLGELVEPMTSWRNDWKSVADRTAGNPPQAFLVMTEDGQATDWELAYAWLYSDLVHADPLKRHTELRVGINVRFHAAAGVIARILERVERTLAMVQLLDEEGLIDLDPAVYTEDVVVKPDFSFELTMAYSAPVGTPLPVDVTQLDPSVWTSLAEDVELLGTDDAV
jgi:hypothetical protein